MSGRLIFSTLVLLLLSGCTVAMVAPVSRFDPPEVTGQIGKFRVGAGYGTETETLLTLDYTTNAIDTQAPPVEWKQGLGFLNAQAGLLPWLDIQYKSLSIVQAKAQFLGQPELNAKAGNLSGSWTIAYGYESENESRSDVFGSGTASYKLNQSKIDTALVLGYRPGDTVMIYGGPYVQWIQFDGSQKTYSASTTSPFDGKSRLLGANAGVRISELGKPTFIGATLYLEGGYYEMKAGGSSRTGASFGTAAEFNL